MGQDRRSFGSMEWDCATQGVIMAVPILEGGPYIFNVNNSGYETNITTKRKKVLLGIKNCIVSLGGAGTIWQVVASSDASSVKNVGDASPDLWVDYTDVNYAASGSPHSWVVLENQTTGYQLSIDYNYSSSFIGYCNVYFSRSGLYFTDGTTSNLPSCLDQKQIWTGAFDPTFDQYDNFYIHGMTSANHKTLRVIVNGKHDTTANEYFSKCILIEEVESAPAGWTSETKCLVSVNPAINPSATASQQSPRFQDISNKWAAYLETAEPYSAWMTCYETVECYDSITNQGKPLCVDMNAHDSLGGYPASKIGLFSIDATRGGSYGRLKDIFFGPTDHLTYDNYPSDSSRQWMKFGCLVVPWDGSDPGIGTARDIGLSDNFKDSGGQDPIRTLPLLYRDLG